MIHIQSATLSYDDKHVLGPFSLDIGDGERVVLLGKSGCGKSTLLNYLYQQVARDASLIPQDLGLVESLSVYHNIYMGRLEHHSGFYNLCNLIRPFPARVAEMQPLLQRLGLESKSDVRVAELSGGQQQRVAVGRAIYRDAPLLMADEPVSALDGPRSDQVLQMLSHHFSTAIITLHDLERALAFASRILLISEGELVLDQPAEKLTVQALDAFY